MVEDDAPVTEEEIKRARSFLVDRLLPDLDKARKAHDAVRAEQKRYELLQIHLRDLDDKQRKQKEKQGQESSAEEAVVSASVDLQDGATLPAEYPTSALPVVDLGKGDIFLEMEQKQARIFVGQKIKQLSKRLDLETERVSKIEAVVHLSSNTLVKLEALHRGEAQTIFE